MYDIFYIAAPGCAKVERKMDRRELAALVTLIGLGAIFGFLTMRMTDGLAIVAASFADMFATYLAVIALSTALVIPVSLLARGQGDERDRAIESRGQRNERFFVLAAVNVLLWQAMWQGVQPGAGLPGLDLRDPSTLFFVLFAMLFVGEFVRLLTVLVLYRRQRGHG